MPTMTIRLSRQQSVRVARLARKKNVSRSEVLRQGIQALEAAPRTALDAWRESIGIVKDGPDDLSTNPKHLKGFGR